MVTAHLYLRASTKDQDANRAREFLLAFADERGYTVAGVYAENFSGTKLHRPMLHALLNNAEPGHILCVESVDRLSRLSQDDWETLKQTINKKGLRLVVADLPTSWDQEKRVERIRQGLANKKSADPTWKAPGKRKNAEKWATVEKLLRGQSAAGMTIREIARAADAGEATIYRIKKVLGL